jgi:hypothetical protein
MTLNTHFNLQSLQKTWLENNQVTAHPLKVILNHAQQISKLNQLFYQWLPQKHHAECTIANLCLHKLVILVTRPALATLILCYQQELLNFMKTHYHQPIQDIQVKVNDNINKQINTLQNKPSKRTISLRAAQILQQSMVHIHHPKLKASIEKIILIAQNKAEKE